MKTVKPRTKEIINHLMSEQRRQAVRESSVGTVFGPALVAYAFRHKIAKGIRSLLGTTKPPKDNKPPKISKAAQRSAQNQSDVDAIHQDIVDRAQRRQAVKNATPAWKPPANQQKSTMSMGAKEYGDYLKSHPTPGDKPSSPPQQSDNDNVSDIKQGQHISASSYRKLLAKNPRLSVRGK